MSVLNPYHCLVPFLDFNGEPSPLDGDTGPGWKTGTCSAFVPW